MNAPTRRSSDAVHVRRVDHRRAADQRAVVDLLAEYLAAIDDPTPAGQRYDWLYARNPHGTAVTYLACADSRAVAMTSLFPRKLRVGSETLLGAIGGDGYVTPDFRRRGIATELHSAAMLGMSSGPVLVMFGPPEPHNLGALIKAGAIPTGEVQRFSRPLSLRGVGRGYGLPGALERFMDRALAFTRVTLRLDRLGSEPDARVDALFERIAAEGDHGVLPVRDAAFYAWRFGTSPSGAQIPYLLLDGDEPVAIAALERARDRAAIVDLLALRSQRRHALWTLVGHCQGVAALRILVHVPTPLRPALALSGFLPRETITFQVSAPPACPQRAQLLDPASWYYTDGDVDLDRLLPPAR